MLTMLLSVTLALACVLVTRRWVRRGFGAGPAFTLWLLPPLAALLPWLPALPPTLTVTPPTWVLAGSASLLPQTVTSTPTFHWALWLWLAGSVCCLLRLALHYTRLLQHSRQPSPTMLAALYPLLDGLPPARVRLHPAGPAVLWAPRSLLLLPEDFLQRFAGDEQRLVLRHELTHLQRGDAWWSALAEFACALLWFHPLAWLALPRLRLDQELACDERLLRQFPHDEARYAHALLHSSGVATTPALIPWLAEPQLQERLSMIKRQRPSALRSRIGFISLAAVMVTGAFAVHSATPPAPGQPASSGMTFASQTAPVYPEDALRNRQQGTVVLDVLVDTHGKPVSLSVHGQPDVAPSLVKAASAAAMQWRFKPLIKDGKAVQGYARVPISFALNPPAPPATPAPPAPTARTGDTSVPPPPPPPRLIPAQAFDPAPSGVPPPSPPPPPPAPPAPPAPSSASSNT